MFTERLGAIGVAYEATGTIGTREPAYPSLPQGGSIGQPPACQLSSAAPAPFFLGRDGGAARGM